MSEVRIKVAADSSSAVTGIKQAENAVKNFKQSSENSLTSIGKQFAGLFAVGAIIGALKATADEMGTLADNADKFGESTESIQRVGYAAQQAGAEFDTVGKAMIKVNGNAKAAIEGNEEMTAAFDAMGISAAEFIDLPMEEKLVRLAEGYEQGGSQAEKLDAVMKVLGKSGADLIPLLSAGPEELRKTLADATVTAESSVRAMATAGDKIEGAFANVKAAFASSLGWVIETVENLSIKFFKLLTVVTNLGKGVTKAFQEGQAYETMARREIEERQAKKEKGPATDTEAIAEAAKKKEDDAAKEKKAVEDLAKLKEQNNAKEEAARLKMLSLKERELEIQGKIEQLKGRNIDSDREREEVRGALLDLEAELKDNLETQAQEAEKEADEKLKREKDLKKEKEKSALEKATSKLGEEQKKLSDLENSRTGVTFSSLRRVGGNLSPNFNPAVQKANAEDKQIELQKQAVEVAKAMLAEMKKTDRQNLSDSGYFN